jgi:hypothetical protein
MRYRLIIFFCVISFSASAQWWHLSFKKHPVFYSLKDPRSHEFKPVTAKLLYDQVQVQPLILEPSAFSLEAQERSIMKLAKHNMSWRIYNLASYNFSDLAQVYIKMHRFSEAKWYLLQSNNISREEHDDKHTIANLVSMSIVKTDLGDRISARADLLEALDLAHIRNLQNEAADVQKNIVMLDQRDPNAPRPELKYAENAEEDSKKPNKPAPIKPTDKI